MGFFGFGKKNKEKEQEKMKKEREPETPRRTRRKTVCRGVSGSLFAMIQIRA